MIWKGELRGGWGRAIHDEKVADEEADEGETFLSELEVVDSCENDREGLEPDVEKAVGKGDIEV